MALGDPYITSAQLKDYLDIPSGDTEDDDRVAAVLAGSTKMIEDYCKRQFNDAGSATAREFLVESRHKAIVDDFSTTTGLVVEVGTKSSGYSTTWTLDTDFFVGPVNQTRNETTDGAYWRIEAMSGTYFPKRFYREPNLRVTARWGWAAAPDNVVQAQYILASRLFRRKDSPDGVIGGFEGNPIRVGYMMDPDVERLLKRYRKHIPGMF